MGESSCLLVRALFLRGLGLIYGIAFLSLGVQVEGLVGREGILPVAELLEGVRERAGEPAWWALPTLCWLDSSDLMLRLLCGGGALLSLLLVAGIAPALVLGLLWVFYLSLVVAGQDFLSFQWDILLLETGFLAVCWAPLTLKPRLVWTGAPLRVVLWLLRLLLFRLMFSSGLVKLLSGDPTWRGLTALHFHYQTQPLPAWTSWYAHQLPGWLHTASVGAMFACELVVPFCVFAPRRWRLWGVGLMALLQGGIAATGNYGFFNLLSVLLCLVLLDDGALGRLRLFQGREVRGRSPSWPRPVVWPVAGLVLLLGVFQLARTARLKVPWPGAMIQLYTWCRPYYLVNAYGLFAVMTTQRPEIVVEGSADGREWRPYEFRWKPGEPGRAPSFAQPHMPRLDWQMWFAALRTYEDYPWFLNFMVRLLQGTPQVLELLERNPFPEGPPRYVRGRLYEYRFTDWQGRQEGQWWQRQELGLYCPILSLGKG